MNRATLLPVAALLAAISFAEPLAAQTYTWTTLAGSAGNTGSDNGIGPLARFNLPAGIAADGEGNLYVADRENQTVRKIVSGDARKFAGRTGFTGATDGPADSLFTTFHGPSGVAVDGAGNVYVSDAENYTIRKIATDASGTLMVSTLAGSAGNKGSSDGTGSAARFGTTFNLATDTAGNIYAADYDNHTIRKITPQGVVTTIAGSAGNAGFVDGPAADARFKSPFGVAADYTGNVYVADTLNAVIRKITPQGIVSTVAGVAGDPGYADGPAAEARLGPTGMAVDLAGNLYVADTLNRVIRKITPQGSVSTIGGLVSTAPGAGTSVDGVGLAARFGAPASISVDVAGVVSVSDFENHVIRRGVPSSPLIDVKFLPPKRTLKAGKSGKVMLMVNNSSMQTVTLKIRFTSNNAGVLPEPPPLTVVAKGKSNVKQKARATRATLQLPVAATQGGALLQASVASWTYEKPCTIIAK